jgi:hypothetical protein
MFCCVVATWVLAIAGITGCSSKTLDMTKAGIDDSGTYVAWEVVMIQPHRNNFVHHACLDKNACRQKA